MPSFPLNLQIRGRAAIIVGGGKVALRKALALRAGGARVRIVAPALDPKLCQALQDDRQAITQREYRTGDLAGALLVIAATDSPAVNAHVLADARAAGILCSDASDPHGGDFTMPATLRLDAITIAVDTGGASPGLARRIVEDVRDTLDPNYGRAAATLSVMRDYARAGLPPNERAAVMAEAVELPVAELAAMNPGQAQHCIDAIVDRRGAANVPVTASLICATRASHLALTQTRMVAAKLAVAGIASTVLPVSTVGDRVQDRSIAAIGTENVFVSELESALRDGRAHYAVHSCKDLPSTLAGDMGLVALSAREDPRDAFCSERFESFAALPSGARIGTSSLRRRVQLLAIRSDLHYVDIRGNVDTRLRKLRDGEYDAIVLAMAGLVRLGARATHTVAFAQDEVVPAAGQGALAVEMLLGHPDAPRV
nr:hydroxymethylbilane synthase [Candidatus Eremiobacteraeota bacterium]